jgi:hypothetical protein
MTPIIWTQRQDRPPLLKISRSESMPIVKTPTMSPLLTVRSDVIRRDNVSSVSCSLMDPELWKMLITEQRRCADLTGLPLQHAFGLSGPDGGLEEIPISEWGGQVHIPFEGACEADLFIQSPWNGFLVDKVRDSGKLRWAVRRQCHYILAIQDYGELACATRTIVGERVLYESTGPYEPINIFLPEKLIQPGVSPSNR